MANGTQKNIYTDAEFFLDREVKGTVSVELKPPDDPKGLITIRASKEKAAKNFCDNFGGQLMGTKV